MLVVFVLAKDAPQPARRCGERAVEHRRSGNLDAARDDFMCGLDASPTDHELHHGLAAVLAGKLPFDVRGKTVVVVASGGNLNLDKFGKILGYHAAKL